MNRSRIFLGIIAYFLAVSAASAGQPLKVLLTPPKGMTLNEISRQQYSWQDDRGAVIDDFKINDDPAQKANQWAPAVAIDREGNSIVVWEDWRNGDRDIYAQVLDTGGKAFGPNFRVNSDQTATGQKDADVIAAGSGSYVIVWRDERNNNNDIYAQFISKAGQLTGANFIIHEANSSDQMNPTISEMSDGSFVVAWEDWRNGNIDIFARKISAAGQPFGPSFKVNSDFTNTDQTDPKLAFDKNGGGMIVWRDCRLAKTVYEGADIYGQRLNNTGGLKGENILINPKDGGDVDQCNPDIIIADNGTMMIVWRDDRNGNLDIFGQLFDPDGQLIGNNILINDDKTVRVQRNPSACINGRGEFMVVWADLRNENFDIYAQCYTLTGLAIGRNIQINDPFGSPAVQTEPSIACDAAGNLVMSWVDYRYMDTFNHKSDVFAQHSFFDNLLDIAEGKKIVPLRQAMTTHQSN